MKYERKKREKIRKKKKKMRKTRGKWISFDTETEQKNNFWKKKLNQKQNVIQIHGIWLKVSRLTRTFFNSTSYLLALFIFFGSPKYFSSFSEFQYIVQQCHLTFFCFKFDQLCVYIWIRFIFINLQTESASIRFILNAWRYECCRYSNSATVAVIVIVVVVVVAIFGLSHTKTRTLCSILNTNRNWI